MVVIGNHRTAAAEAPVTVADHIQKEHGIVGRSAELEIALAVISSGRHLLLEGPVGVGKTTVALAVCDHLERAVLRIDGDERYTENKLTGWFDPPIVLKSGYGEESFFPGPLVRAMRDGSILFINEMNRMPESVQNVLLPALDEGLLILPRIGEVRAKSGFQVVATQNPVEYIATGHLSEALKDRFEHVPLLYQSETEEREIVRRETGSTDAELINSAVRIARVTRSHPRFRKGASIRAAVSIVAIAEKLSGPDRLRPATLTALATRVELRDEEDADLASAVDEILSDLKKN
jgi:MoxR-like ATPase